MWFLLACSASAPVAEPIPEVVTVQTDGVTVDDMNALRDEVDRRLSGMEERLGNLEMQVAEISEAKLADADQVAYDPSRTTLSATDLQQAIDELAGEVSDAQRQDMGTPGDRLFDIPKDTSDGGAGKKKKGKKELDPLPGEGEGPNLKHGPGGG